MESIVKRLPNELRCRAVIDQRRGAKRLELSLCQLDEDGPGKWPAGAKGSCHIGFDSINLDIEITSST